MKDRRQREIKKDKVVERLYPNMFKLKKFTFIIGIKKSTKSTFVLKVNKILVKNILQKKIST
jgi:hypothetical protein